MKTIKVNTKMDARIKGLYRHPASRFFWFRFKVNGKEYRLSTGETDEAKAIEAARQIRENPPVVVAADLNSEIERFVADRSDNYKRNTLPIFKKFARAFEGVALREITTAKIQAWIDKLEVKPNTREAYRFQVQKFFDALVDSGKVRSNPAREVKVETEERSTRKNWIHKRQWSNLFEACSDLELKFALYCALHAGLRKDEVIMFRPEWIDREIGEYGVLHVTFADDWHPKDGTERTIPLSPEFRDFLDNGFPRLPGKYMIAPYKVKEPGERYRVEFRTKFENLVAKKAGLGHFTFHDLRRSFASNLVSAGVSIYKVAKWLGDDVEVVQRTYGHLDPADGELAAVFGSKAPSNVVQMQSGR